MITFKSDGAFEAWVAQLSRSVENFDAVRQEVVQEIADRLLGVLKASLGQGEWEPLDTLQLALTARSIKVAKDDLLDSLKVLSAGTKSAVIGTSDHPNADVLSWLLNILERGITIEVTDDLRGWLATKGMFLKEATTDLVIPPLRSFEELMQEVDVGDLMYRMVGGI